MTPRLKRRSATLLLCLLPAVATAQPEDGGADEALEELRRGVEALAAIDAAHPELLLRRLDYARALRAAGEPGCDGRLNEAARELAPILGAAPELLLALPELLPEATGLSQMVLLSQGLCAEDPDESRALLEQSITTGERAVSMLRDAWLPDEMSTARFNVAFAHYQLGQLETALQHLEDVVRWDIEYGMRDELASDYETLLRWRHDGADPDPAEVEAFVAALRPTKARFEFAWTPHESHWTMQRERLEWRNGRHTALTIAQDARMSAGREGDHWLLKTVYEGEPRVTTGAGEAPAGFERLGDVISALAASPPETLINADGSFRELRNLEALRQQLGGALEQLGGAADPARTRQVLDTVLNRELLTAMVQGEWELMVAAWIDAEFDHGEWYATELAEPVPGMTDRPVRKRFEFKVARWLPCGGQGPPRCVEVLVRIALEPESASALTLDVVRRLAPQAQAAELEKAMAGTSIGSELRYRLVTEPDTLRPWSVEERRYTHVSITDGGRRLAMARRDTTTQTVRYLN